MDFSGIVHWQLHLLLMEYHCLPIYFKTKQSEIRNSTETQSSVLWWCLDSYIRQLLPCTHVLYLNAGSNGSFIWTFYSEQHHLLCSCQHETLFINKFCNKWVTCTCTTNQTPVFLRFNLHTNHQKNIETIAHVQKPTLVASMCFTSIIIANLANLAIALL